MFRSRTFFAAATLVVVAAAGLSLADRPVFSTPPPGVTADEWHPISETLGLAVRYRSGARGERELAGTLMVKEGARWQAVNVSPNPVGIVPAR